MDIPIEFVALVGVLIGVGIKTLFPYWKKCYEDPDISFNWGYAGTMLMSAIVSGVLLFPTFEIPEGNMLTVLVTAIFFAAGVNSVFNYVLKGKIQK